MLEEIKKAIKSGEPFEIRMVDGKVYPVPHQDFIAINPKGFSVAVYEDDGIVSLPVRQITGVLHKHEDMVA